MNINVNFITNIHILINMNEIFIKNIIQYNNIQLTFIFYSIWMKYLLAKLLFESIKVFIQ